MTITETHSTDARAGDEAADEFAEQVFGDLLGAVNTYALTIGTELGWYDALASGRPTTSGELASATDTDERYAREWLEHQTVAGYLEVIDATAGPTDRRYRMTPAAAAVLADRESLAYMAPFGGFLSSLGRNLDELIRVYRTGEGFGWHDHGDGARCGQAEANRPMFTKLLATEYLPSIAKARAYAEEAGVAERVRFHAVDVGDLEAGGYDLVLALECVHDMPDPVSVLAAMHTMVEPDGVVVVMDERVGDTFTGEPDPVEQLFYGFSLVCCLPDGRNAPESVATGTVMRLPTLERYAVEAGFAGVEVLPIENDFFRFYRLSTS